jgi:hypothetical protein
MFDIGQDVEQVARNRAGLDRRLQRDSRGRHFACRATPHRGFAIAADGEIADVGGEALVDISSGVRQQFLEAVDEVLRVVGDANAITVCGQQRLALIPRQSCLR